MLSWDELECEKFKREISFLHNKEWLAVAKAEEKSNVNSIVYYVIPAWNLDW